MSLDARVVGIMAARRVDEARRAEKAAGRSRATLARAVRGMNDLFEGVAEGEASWRREVYQGDRAYDLDDDAAVVRLYREWAVAAADVARSAASHAGPNGPARGLKRLKRRLADVKRLIDDPAIRLIDFPSVGLKVDPAMLDVRPLSAFLAERPELAESTRAADEAVARGEVELTSLSEYLLARGTR